MVNSRTTTTKAPSSSRSHAWRASRARSGGLATGPAVPFAPAPLPLTLTGAGALAVNLTCAFRAGRHLARARHLALRSQGWPGPARPAAGVRLVHRLVPTRDIRASRSPTAAAAHPGSGGDRHRTRRPPQHRVGKPVSQHQCADLPRRHPDARHCSAGSGVDGAGAGAPASPALAGGAAGFLAATAAAALYAFHCFDDSPLFVVTWYTLAAVLVVAVGAVAGHRMLRW